MVFSTNQNRHLFVVNSVLSIAANATSAAVATALDGASVGNIAVRCTSNGVEKELHFLYKGVNGVLKSDKIQVKNISYAKAIAAADMKVPLKKIEVELAANPVAGQDYVLRINFKNFFGMSDEHQYFKDAAVRATTGMTKAQFMTAMVKALNLSFSREVGATTTSNPYLSFTVSGDKLVIEEKEQEWTLGTQKLERVNFEVQPTTIFDGVSDVIWAKQNATTGYYYTDVTSSNTNKIGNGKMIADLEWFCMGERGDQFRYMGYPNYIPTQYLVNPAAEYNVLEIHHAFTDTGVNSYKSEKDITIVATTPATINSIVSAINTATGLSIATLSTD